VDRVNIVLANTKGGVGKSTLAVHLAVWLYDQGASVALLDTDKQRSSSQWIAEAEPQVTTRTATTPEECLSELQGLARTHDFVVGDGPGGLDDVSRTLLILADLALLPITPSILDLRSVQQATAVLGYAQGINGGKPSGRLILNKMRKRDRISQELRATAPGLGVDVAGGVIRDLLAYRDAAQQGTVVTRMIRKAKHAAHEMDTLFTELLPGQVRNQTQNFTNKEMVHG
jgi:chromosome partitioning protein